jgi:CheY-like chemotaxis protein
MGGAITVTSAPGVGSTFTLTLPRTPVVAAPPLPSPDAAQAAAPPSDATLATRLVLVIDDDPNVRDLLPRALARSDLHFETAASAAEGLELAMALLPDLIILDVQLPDFDGWTVLSQLKADPATLAIPVLMLTIDAGADQGIQHDAAGILHKPIELDQLAHKLTALLPEDAAPPLALVAGSQGLAKPQREG